MGNIQNKSFYAASKKKDDGKKCKKCGKSHSECFDTGAAIKRDFAKKFLKFMED